MCVMWVGVCIPRGNRVKESGASVEGTVRRNFATFDMSIFHLCCTYSAEYARMGM